MLAAAGAEFASFTLMSSGPGALTGPRARDLRAMLATLGVGDGGRPDTAALRAGIAELWRSYLEPQAVTAGVPADIVAFLGRRMRGNDPDGLVLMAAHMLAAPDRTAELARLDRLPMLVIYGENDNSWSPAAQENMARRLRRSPAVHPGGRALPRRRGARHHGQRADPVLGRGRGRADVSRVSRHRRRYRLSGQPPARAPLLAGEDSDVSCGTTAHHDTPTVG